MSARLVLPVSASTAEGEDGWSVGAPLGRREQVVIETDTGLFDDDVGSVDTTVSRRDCVTLC